MFEAISGSLQALRDEYKRVVTQPPPPPALDTLEAIDAEIASWSERTYGGNQ